MPRKPLRSLITPEEAPGLVAVTTAMHTAVCEHLLALTYNAQARIMNPGVQSPDERRNGQHEHRILALSRAISQAALALSRLPVPTDAGLVAGARSVGAQAPHYPATQRLLEGILYVHDTDPEAARPKKYVDIMAEEERLFRRKMAPLLGAINRGELPGQPNARPDWEEHAHALQAGEDALGLNNLDSVDRMDDTSGAYNFETADRMDGRHDSASSAAPARGGRYSVDSVDRMDGAAWEAAENRPFGSSPTPTSPPTRPPSPRPRVRVL